MQILKCLSKEKNNKNIILIVILPFFSIPNEQGQSEIFKAFLIQSGNLSKGLCARLLSV